MRIKGLIFSDIFQFLDGKYKIILINVRLEDTPWVGDGLYSNEVE